MKKACLYFAAVLALCAVDVSAQTRTLVEEAARCAGWHDAGEASRIKVGMDPKPEIAAQSKAKWFALAKQVNPELSLDEMEHLARLAATGWAPTTDLLFEGLASKNMDRKTASALKISSMVRHHCDGVAAEIQNLAR